MTHAVIGPTNEVYRYSDNINPNEIYVKKGFKVLPVEYTDPAYDSSVQVKEGPVTTVLPDKVTVVYTLRDKTAQELDDDKTGMIDSLDRRILRIIFNQENRLRVLEGKANVTFQQFKTALKNAL